ncbi:MAG TPA: DnaD domain protein [Anaerolineales bacterium]|nr:DnaD domain protein [Anaerolineales bacterium]
MTTPSPFSGFPEGPSRPTPLPDVFFTELLPSIDHLGELKVTLLAIRALAGKEGPYRYLSHAELVADADLQAVLGGAEALEEALERAVARGSLLRVPVEKERDVYFLNSPKGRAALRALEAGEWRPQELAGATIDLTPSRPTIFALYEQNIGPLTPMIAEHLREAEESYPQSWIEEALRIAVDNNVRKWSYVRAILEDWRTRGKDEREDRGSTEKARRRYADSLDV